MARQIVAGEAVDASRVLFQVADTSRMWLTLNVSAENVGKLALGQPVRSRPDGSSEDLKEATGKIVWISTTADRQTRMVTIRAELPNPHGALRSETFGAGRIVVREERDAVVVPSEAIHWEGCCHVVFVRDKGYADKPESFKVFHVRMVRPGAKKRESNGDCRRRLARRGRGKQRQRRAPRRALEEQAGRWMRRRLRSSGSIAVAFRSAKVAAFSERKATMPHLGFTGS